MTIKTFRGLIADGAQDTIVLHTNDGSTGYRIVKFQLFAKTPGTVDIEQTVKIYKIQQTAVDGEVDFSDQTLLAAAYLTEGASVAYPYAEAVIFDEEIFNQDIYITNNSSSTAAPTNYYLELEQVKLALDENTVATLKDIRNVVQLR